MTALLNHAQPFAYIAVAFAAWWLARFFAPRPETPLRRWDGMYPIDSEGEVERVFHTPYDQDRNREAKR